MNILITIVIAIIVIVFLLFIYYLWFMLWGLRSDNLCEDEIIELHEEIKWWKHQVREIWKDRDNMKKQLSQVQAELEVLEIENRWYIELLEKYDERYWPYKATIEETYKARIIELYKEWKTLKEIAEAIGCWKSTVQRAVAKRGLKR